MALIKRKPPAPVVPIREAPPPRDTQVVVQQVGNEALTGALYEMSAQNQRVVEALTERLGSVGKRVYMVTVERDDDGRIKKIRMEEE